MAKQSGLGDNFYVDGYNLSGDVTSVDKIYGGPTASPITGIDKSAMERVGLLRDGGIDVTTWFNDAALAEHVALRALPDTDTIVTYARGTTLGNPAACCVAKRISYDPTRAADGGLSFKVAAVANGYGVEWGTQLTAGVRSDTTATNGTSVDFGAAGSNGGQAYLQVFSFTGTSVTVKIQSSSDNGGSDAFSDVSGLGFTAATGRTTQRLAVTGALERYLRVVTTGTFSAATFSVVFVRNDTAVSF